jgi:hypothetical protein
MLPLEDLDTERGTAELQVLDMPVLDITVWATEDMDIPQPV